MAILQRLARLTVDVLTVEAGSSIETTIEVGPFVGVTTEEVREFQVGVGGLPASWYSISTERLRVPAGIRAGRSTTSLRMRFRSSAVSH